MTPGDEAPPGTLGTGENICPKCRGSGRIGSNRCEHCGGTGKITEGLGGG
jgi:DnaJ-class molecular chaperone